MNTLSFIALVIAALALFIAALRLYWSFLSDEEKYPFRIKLHPANRPRLSARLEPLYNTPHPRPAYSLVLENKHIAPPFPVILQLWVTSYWSVDPLAAKLLRSEDILGEEKKTFQISSFEDGLWLAFVYRNLSEKDVTVNKYLHYSLSCADVVVKKREMLEIPTWIEPSSLSIG